MIDINIDEIDPLNFDLGQAFGMSDDQNTIAEEVVNAIEHDDVLLGSKERNKLQTSRKHAIQDHHPCIWAAIPECQVPCSQVSHSE
jgi:hypothetical protein